MSRYSKVARSMWREPQFRDLSGAAPCAQLLYLRLLTGPENTSLPGLFPAWASGLAESLRWSRDALLERFGELVEHGFAEADWDLGIVWLPRAIELNRPESPSVVKSWGSTWAELPDCQVKSRAFLRLQTVTSEMGAGFAKAFVETCGSVCPTPCQTVCPTPCAQGVPHQEQEQEQEQEERAPLAPLAPLRLVPGTASKAGTAVEKRGTRAPASVDPTASEWCKAHGIPEPIPGSEAAKFLDYWAALPGQRGLKLNWPATWRARPDWTKGAPRPARGPGQQPVDHTAPWLQEGSSR